MELFSLDEIQKLKSIFKIIIPSCDSGMPEAELILNCIDLDNSNHTKFFQISKEICAKIASQQIESEDDLNKFKKANFRDFSVFVNLVLIIYYSEKTVLSKLNVGSIPPFPGGNFVKEGDLYLLEQVFIKGPIYRH